MSSTSQSGTKSNSCSDFDESRLISNSLGRLDGCSASVGPPFIHTSIDGSQISVTTINAQSVPAIRLISLQNIFSEGQVGGTINGDVVGVVKNNQFAQSEMS